jgi:hypothetical protein
LGLATAFLSVMASPSLVLACAFPRSHDDEAEEAQREQRLKKWVQTGLAAIPEIVRFGCDFEHTEEARTALAALGPSALPALFDAYVGQLSKDEDCRDAAGSVVEQALRDSEDRQGRQVILHALASRDLYRVRAAIFVIEGLAENPGEAGSWLLERSVRPIKDLFERDDRAMWTAALSAMEKMPFRFRDSAPRLEALLEDRQVSNWALAVLTNLSPPTDGTVLWLRRHLASPAESDRAGWLASRIAALRPAPPSALPELWDRLRDDGGETCFTRTGHVQAFAGAILAIDPNGQQSAAAGLGTLSELKTASATAAQQALHCGQSRVGIEPLLKLLPPADAASIWLSLMNEADVEMDVRHLAAKALAKTPLSLTPRQQRLRQLLTERKSVGGDPFWDPRTSAQRLSTALGNCRREAGVDGSAPSIVDATNPELDRSYSEAAACLDLRLCGPEPEAYRRALAACCAYAFRSPPAWCGDGHP